MLPVLTYWLKIRTRSRARAPQAAQLRVSKNRKNTTASGLPPKLAKQASITIGIFCFLLINDWRWDFNSGTIAASEFWLWNFSFGDPRFGIWGSGDWAHEARCKFFRFSLFRLPQTLADQKHSHDTQATWPKSALLTKHFSIVHVLMPGDCLVFCDCHSRFLCGLRWPWPKSGECHSVFCECHSRQCPKSSMTRLAQKL